MSSTLIISLPQLPDDLAATSAADLHCDYQYGDQAWHSANLQQLGQLMQAEPATPTQIDVYLSGVNVLASTVTAPRKQHKHLARILPFLCEEQLAQDIDSLHVVAGRIFADNVTVCAISKRLLSQLLALLDECHLAPSRISSEVDLLRTALQPGQSLLWVDQHCCQLVIAQQAVSLAREQLKYALETLQQQAEANLLLCYDPGSAGPEINLAIEDLKARGTTVIEQPLDHPELSCLQQLFQLALASGAAINLLQGPYASKKNTANTINWRPLALAASVLVGLNLVYSLASGIYFSSQAGALHQQSEALYRSYFPDDKRIINIKTQTQGHLSRGQGYSNGGFLHMLHNFIGPWGDYRNQLTLKSLRFNQQRDELLMEIESRSIEQLDKLQSSLGERAELLSANEDGNSVRGRIKLQGSQP